MTISRGTWVKQNGQVGVTAVEARRADAATYYQAAAGTARTGLLGVNIAALQLVTATSGWSYNLQPMPGFVIGRAADEGAYTMSSQGVTNVGTGAAPAAGLSRWDLVYIKQNDIEKGDPDNLPVLGVTQGTAASSPTKPTASVPNGAVVLAEAQIFSGTTGTTTSPNTLTQLWRYTALVGQPVPVRTKAERDALGAARPGDQVLRLDLGYSAIETYNGSAWLGPARFTEFTTASMTQTAANGKQVDVQLTRDTTRTNNGGFVTGEANGYMTFNEPGSYLVTIQYIGSAATGNTQIWGTRLSDGANTVSQTGNSYGGNTMTATTLLNVTAEGDQYRFGLTSSATISFTARFKVAKVG